MGDGLAVSEKSLDELSGGALVAGGGFAGFEFGVNIFGEDFAEFDAPLVEGIDVPNGALDEDLVLVEGNELAEGMGGEFGEHEGV